MDSLNQALADSLLCVAPATWLLLSGCVLAVAGGIAPRRWVERLGDHRSVWGSVCLLLLVVAVGMKFAIRREELFSHGLFVWDDLASFGETVVLLCGILIVMASWHHVPSANVAEHYGCLTLILSGLLFVGSANDLVVLLLGLELISIPTYIILAINAHHNRGWEALLKYFTLSAFASCFFMLGLSLLFGLAGTTELGGIHAALAENDSSTLAAAGVALVLAGIAYRLTAVPFQFYASDVFAGTPLSVIALLSVLPKVAGVLALCRLFGGSSLDATLSGQALWPLVGLSAATIVIGNVMALVQTETKRLLAHSGIANSGYLLLGCAALLAHNAAAKPLFTFLCAYAAMTLGAIAILAALEHSHHSIGSLEDLRGLFYRFPLAAAFLSVALLSMIGMPLTAGFWAKLQMFLSAVVTGRAEFFGLGVLMAISSVIGLVYYARLVVMMFERPGANGPVEHHRLERSVPLLCAGACTALTLFWFFAPNAL